MDIVIGIDIGGTLVRVAGTDLQGELLGLREAPIEARRGPRAGMEKIARLIEGLLEEQGAADRAEPVNLLGIGVGCTGPVDPVSGIVNNPYTLPTWENVPLRSWLEGHFSVPVRLENDADVAALGEYWKGAGQGFERLYAITVGTGIGTALVIDGEIYRGLNGSHPEGGHQTIDPAGPQCYCGARGCWESLASGPAIARMAREMVAGYRDPDEAGDRQLEPAEIRRSPLLEMDDDRIDARTIARLAENDDPLAVQIIARAAHYFSLGVANIVLLFTPDLVVLSGGVMKSAALFMPTLKEVVMWFDGIVPAGKVQIRQAELGAHAGVYGAAYSILQRLNR